MRAVHIAAAAATEMCGVFIDAGTRDDPSDRPGLAHFVEHTIFKGTQRRRAWHINCRMETVGGEVNAFTAKEETFVYAVGPAGCLSRAADLVADLVSSATFPKRDIDIERNVVCDEIDSYRDTPAEAVYDDFEDAIFAGSQLGHNILGTRNSVELIESADCRAFVDRLYTPGRMVFFYIGRRGPSPVFQIAERFFGTIARKESAVSRTAPDVNPVFNLSADHGTHQANTVLGKRIPGAADDDRYALALLANILGGPGMNSLLNLELRERHGLVYSVEAATTLYSDCGMMTIAYGCDPHDDHRCHELVCRVLSERLAAVLTPRKIEAAKRQYLGQLTVSNDNRENLAFRAARSLYWRGHAVTPGETAAAIEALTPQTLHEATIKWLDPDSFSKLTLF